MVLPLSTAPKVLLFFLSACRSIPSNSAPVPYLYRLDRIDETLEAMRAFREVKPVVVS